MICIFCSVVGLNLNRHYLLIPSSNEDIYVLCELITIVIRATLALILSQLLELTVASVRVTLSLSLSELPELKRVTLEWRNLHSNFSDLVKSKPLEKEPGKYTFKFALSH